MIRIVFSPIGIIIGETTTSEAGMLSLKEPRMLNPLKSEGNITTFDVLPLLGAPKGLTIGRECINWDCTDESICKRYREIVTGLTVVQRQPLVDKDGKALQ